MKKILFIMPTMGGGGAEKSQITILRNFDYARYEVSLLLAHELGAQMDEIPAGGKVISALGKTVSLCEKIAYNLSNKFHLHFFERWFIRRKIPFGFDTIISFCEGRALKMHGYICDKGKGVESLFEACCTMMDDISYRSRYATLAAERSKLFDSDKILNQIYKVITL